MVTYCVYRFYNEDDELLYVGQTKQELYDRMNAHKLSKVWWNEVVRVDYAECVDGFEMDTYETYYIRNLKPRYNIQKNGISEVSFSMKELVFKPYNQQMPQQTIANDNNPVLTLKLTPELKKEFRLRSIEEELSMKQLGRKIIREYLARVKNDGK